MAISIYREINMPRIVEISVIFAAHKFLSKAYHTMHVRSGPVDSHKGGSPHRSSQSGRYWNSSAEGQQVLTFTVQRSKRMKTNLEL